uniref:Uncharacterized protein n=2 Tax=Physcomitrium patens TaxID=3218 RepID=A0A2K1IIH6_PHYPA|nr:hypothetical protein PHYPA_027770 [Physcomitrium patens]
MTCCRVRKLIFVSSFWSVLRVAFWFNVKVDVFLFFVFLLHSDFTRFLFVLHCRSLFDFVMADTKIIKEENPELFRNPGKGWVDHVHQQNLKKGIERLDRRSEHPNKGAVKKHGHGGKFTVDGPYREEDYANPVPVAMDKNDPNYVDPEEEEADNDAGVPVSDTAKDADTSAGAAHPAV